MTAARLDATLPVQPAPPMGEWPVAPRFTVIRTPLQLIAAEPEPVAPEPVAIEPTPEPVAIEPTPEPVAIEPTPEPVAIEPAPEPTPEPAAAPPAAPILEAVAEPETTIEPETAVAPDAVAAPETSATPTPPPAPAVEPMPAAPVDAPKPMPPGVIAMPQVPATFEPAVAPWPYETVADLRPPGSSTGGGRFSGFPMPSRQLVLVALLAGAAGLAAFRSFGGEPEPIDAATPVSAQSAAPAAASADWAAAIPTKLPPGIVDAVTLDEREVRPARTRNQLRLALEAMKPGEVIRELTIRTDGSVQLLVVRGAAERYVVTKGDAPPAPAPAAAAAGTSPAPILAIDPIEIDVRIPRKFLRKVENTKGVPPTSMQLIRGPEIRGGKPTWVIRWEGQPGQPVTSLYATQDGKVLATSIAGLPQ